MNKLIEQRRRATEAYQQRRRSLGWKQINIIVPQEVKTKILLYRDALLKEYLQLHPEENPRVPRKY